MGYPAACMLMRSDSIVWVTCVPLLTFIRIWQLAARNFTDPESGLKRFYVTIRRTDGVLIQTERQVRPAHTDQHSVRFIW